MSSHLFIDSSPKIAKRALLSTLGHNQSRRVELSARFVGGSWRIRKLRGAVPTWFGGRWSDEFVVKRSSPGRGLSQIRSIREKRLKWSQ
jgi:hypothetical protein